MIRRPHPAVLVALALTAGCAGGALRTQDAEREEGPAAAGRATRADAPARPGPPPEADDAAPHAEVVRDAGQCPEGPLVGCAPGDLRLANGRAVFVVEGPGRGQDFALTGGNLVDAALRGRPDLLAQAYLYLDDTFPRQARYAAVRVADPGGPGREAIVRAEGVDSEDPHLAVTTDYRLGDAPWLCLETTVTNGGEAPVTGYELGDALQWGVTRHFAPGPGFELKGRVHEGRWMAGLGRGTSYAWVAPGGPFRALSGSSWSDPIVRTVDLPPGASATYRRCLVLGTGDVGSLLPGVGALTGEPLAWHAGVVREAETGAPLGPGRVEIGTADGPYALVDVDPEGGWRVPLPAGEWTAAGRYPGRRTVRPARLTADATAEVVLSRQGTLRLYVDELHDDLRRPADARPAAGRRPVPARVTLKGLDVPDPDLGPPWSGSGSKNRILLPRGEAEARLPPGRYRVHASRGLEYDLDTREVEVRAGGVTEVRLALRRTVDTTGWLSADLHQHAERSYDAFLTLEDRVISNAAEGVELLVGTDHDVVTDYAPVIRRLGLQDHVASVVGVEVTTSDTGHFNCFPLVPRPGAPGDGALPSFETSPARIFAACRDQPQETVVQANHPRASGDGYFRLTGFDPTTGEAAAPDRSHPHVAFDPGFDALELMNGKRPQDTDRVLADWFALLNRGRRYTATANSDSHDLVESAAGYPRNFVRLGHDDPAAAGAPALVDAVKHRRAVVGTNGPFPELTAKDTGVGGTVRVRRGESVSFRVRVQAAGWVPVDRVILVKDGEEAVRVPVDPALRAPVRYEGSHALTFERSGWVVLLVRGSEPLSPVVASPPDAPVTAVAFTNPIWVEVE